MDTDTDIYWQTLFADNDRNDILLELSKFGSSAPADNLPRPSNALKNNEKNVEENTVEKSDEKGEEKSEGSSKHEFYLKLFNMGLTRDKVLSLVSDIENTRIVEEDKELEALKGNLPRILSVEENSFISEAIKNIPGDSYTLPRQSTGISREKNLTEEEEESKGNNLGKNKNEKEQKNVDPIPPVTIRKLASRRNDVTVSSLKNDDQICRASVAHYFPAAQSIAGHLEHELVEGRTSLKVLHEMIFRWREEEGEYYSVSSGRMENVPQEGDVGAKETDEEKRAVEDFYREYPREKKEERHQRKLAEATRGGCSSLRVPSSEVEPQTFK